MATATTSTGAEQIHWDLTHLYPGDARSAIEADLSQADELAQGFERDYRGAVAALDATGMGAQTVTGPFPAAPGGRPDATAPTCSRRPRSESCRRSRSPLGAPGTGCSKR